MSKVLIVSDSHGLTKELIDIRERHSQEVDLMIHCGDSQLMPGQQAMLGYKTVAGNCDFADFPQELLEEVSGKRIYITHGHHYSVKSSLMRLQYRAAEVKADIVCFGHSHELGAEMIDGVLFVNPGSIRLPRVRPEKTYVILDIQSQLVKLSVFEVNGRKSSNLAREFHF
ncbi:metallophosphoesterase family protein [Bacillus rubiinfantis]|uniref:metallophosphoesterase family protein n=1 Tax=Bacillus rubiinfantis TaxID=1499680 RepID=UPI0005A629D6|nr:metallophosphoesterase [Bacillus rubiinfantis]